MGIPIDIKTGEIKLNNEQPRRWIAGIDLGTTNSLLAVMQDNQPEVVVHRTTGKTLCPSIVFFDSDGTVIVGEEAKKMISVHPERTIYSVKRLLGKSYADLSKSKNSFSYKIYDDGQENSLVKIEIDNKYYTPLELSALILKEIKSNAEIQLGCEITDTVITVPAYFNDAQRQATRDAGKLAGLNVLRIVNEPTAASLAYGLGLDKNSMETVAVYDLGGGTFDVSILRIENGIFEVLSTNGNTELGGDDIDMAIVDYWKDILKLKDVNNSELKFLAEEAKKILSTNTLFSGYLSGVKLELTIEKLEELTDPIVQKTLGYCLNALNDAGLKTNDIDKVILVGGSTRMPLVKKMVSEFFDKEVFDQLNPDEVVALGAAVQADVLAGNRKDMLLLDVTPLSLGIETLGGLMDVIISRNSTVPVKAARQYTTSVDGQANLKIAIYQGERDLVADNRFLGEFILKDIPPMPAGIPKIEIKFILDADGILTVKAAELRTNIETSIEIRSAYSLSEEEMATMLLNSLKNAEYDMNIRMLLEARNEALTLHRAGTKFIKQNRNIISSHDLPEIERLLKELEQCKEYDEKDLINNIITQFNRLTEPYAHQVMDMAISGSLKGEKVL